MNKILMTIVFLVTSMETSWSMYEDKEQELFSTHIPTASPLEQSNKSPSVTPLASVFQSSLNPGVYESDDIAQILSFPLANFGDQDLMIFDIDQTLITQLDPYYYAHQMKNTTLHKKFTAQHEDITDKFYAYAFLNSPLALMDERIPSFVKKLQEQGVRCIANSAMHSRLPSVESINIPLFRGQSLQKFTIDFSVTNHQLSHWDFNTIKTTHNAKCPPMYKDGIILSSGAPKHITTLELLKKLNFKPRRVAFVDDLIHNVQEMYDALKVEGVECYSFHYSKANKCDLQSYFPSILFNQHLIELETFIEKLLNGENLDEFFHKYMTK